LSCYLPFTTLELLWQSLITLTIKRIHKYSRWLGWARFFLTIIITIMEGLGLFFVVAISIVGGGIYLHFDHKHFHNNFFCLGTFFSQPLNYCDNLQLHWQ
jgi:hypothetical protein